MGRYSFTVTPRGTRSTRKRLMPLGSVSLPDVRADTIRVSAAPAWRTARFSPSSTPHSPSAVHEEEADAARVGVAPRRARRHDQGFRRAGLEHRALLPLQHPAVARAL